MKECGRFCRKENLSHKPIKFMTSPFMDATTASLSQWHITTKPFHHGPQMAVATMIGRNSLAAIDAEANPSHSPQGT